MSVLIVGERGTGRHALARVWRAAAGVGEADLPTVNLDRQPDDVPFPCVGISSKPPASGRSGAPRPPAGWTREAELLHLDTGKSGLVPETECGPSVSADDIALPFTIRLYVPPLRRRLIDVLALVHFYAGRLAGLGFTAVHSRLIHRLLLDSSWPGNEKRLVEYLRARAADGPPILRDDELDQAPAGRTGAVRHFAPDERKPPHLLHQRLNWECENVNVPTERLPQVALSILIERFWMHTQAPDHPSFQWEWTSAPQHPLGPAVYWASPPGWASIVDLSRVGTEAILAADPRVPAGRELPTEVVSAVEKFQDFGATVASIQAGLRASLSGVPADVYPVWGPVGDAAVTPGATHPVEPSTAVGPPSGRKSSRKRESRQKPPSEQQLAVYDLVRQRKFTVAQAALETGRTRANVYKLLSKIDRFMAAANSRSRSVDSDRSHIDNADRPRDGDETDEDESWPAE